MSKQQINLQDTFLNLVRKIISQLLFSSKWFSNKGPS